VLDDAFETLIAELGAAIGLPELKLDEDGACTLSFDDNITVNLRLDPETDAVVLYSPLGLLEADGSVAVKDALLEANLLFQGTGGCTLGVDSNMGLVVLAYREHVAQVRAPLLMERIEAFVNVAEAWRERLERLQSGQADGAEKASSRLGSIPGMLA